MGGPLLTEGYICATKGAKLELSDVNLPPLKSTHVEVEIEMVGLCHTDIHMVDNDWESADYPLLPGHEGVGRVIAKGEEVSRLQIGDRVGIAWIRDSCKDCEKCKEGRENMCADYFQGTYLGKSFGPWGRAKERYNEHGGCFVRVQRIEERFAVRIPHNIPSELACPLLCGGSTVYEPIVEFTQPGTRLGISSIGGLGTLAIKLGKIMGCHVTAISSSAEKEAGARKAGAETFVCTKNESAFEKLKNSLDVIIDTSPANADISPFLELLRQGGTYVRVGIPPATDNTFSYRFSFLISYQKRIAGSLVSGSKRMDEMFQIVSDNLEFMVADDEKWKAKVRPMSEINEAMDELKSRTAKGYRQVLAW